MTDWCARVKNFFRTDRGDDLLSTSPMTLDPSPEKPRRRLLCRRRGGSRGRSRSRRSPATSSSPARAAARQPGRSRAARHRRGTRGGSRRQAPAARLRARGRAASPRPTPRAASPSGPSGRSGRRWSSSRATSGTAWPWRAPPSTVTLKPQAIKAAYLTYYGIADKGIRERVFDLLDRTELNAVVIDVKGDRGLIPYRTQVPAALEAGALGPVIMKDFDKILADLKSRNVYTIARIVAFKENVLASGPARAGRHRHAHRQGLDRQREARLGGPDPRGGLGLPHRGGQGSRRQGLRRDPVRLRALPDRRQALRRQVLEADHPAGADRDHRRLPRQGAQGAGADGRLPRRGHLRLHRVQRQRHRHRAAHRGSRPPRRLSQPHGLSLGLSPGDPRLPESGESTPTRSSARASGSRASAPRASPSRSAPGSRTSRTTPSTSASSA